MSGCPGCFSSGRGARIELQNTIHKAQLYADEKQITMAVVKEAGEYTFVAVDYALRANLPIEAVVAPSPVNP